MLELCMSGQALRIDRLSSLAHTMKAFIGRLIWGLFGSAFSLGDLIILATKKRDNLPKSLQWLITFCNQTATLRCEIDQILSQIIYL